MDRDDQRRYFVVGSAVLEIVTPLFRQRLENDYKNHGFASFQAFADSQPIIHILFHLRHTNVWCCQDKNNCRSRASLPLNYNQWALLFKQVNQPIRNHPCHCQYTANPVQLEDLDITLAGLILRNCCNLGPAEEIVIKGLLKFKNNYLSHNTKGRITETEYNTVWPELTRLVLQLDNTKQDDLIRIENRPLDGSLCAKYCLQLLDIHQKLDEMNESIQSIIRNGSEMQTTLQGNESSLQRIDMNIQELLFYAKRGATCQCYKAPDILPVTPNKLGESIFHLHHQFDLRSVFNAEWIDFVIDGVMMDDGRLVLCLPRKYRLLICNTDGSQTDSIPLQYPPRNVTAVNNSTVAVISYGSHYIVMYNINNKHRLKSIQIPGVWCGGITTINNKLVVGGRGKLYIIDHQTGKVVQKTMVEWSNTLNISFIHATGDRIFYSDAKTNNLCCYSYTDDTHSTTTLRSTPWRITSLQGGSLYVLCGDGSVQHVSPDGKHYKPVTTERLKSEGDPTLISYNQKQRKLFTCIWGGETVQVFNEK